MPETTEKIPHQKAVCVLHSWLAGLTNEVRFPQEGEEGDLICRGRAIVVRVLKDTRVERPRLPIPADLLPDEAFCPRCGLRTTQVGERFGFRNMTPKAKRGVEADAIRPQSQCRECRGALDNRSPKLMLRRKSGGRIARLDCFKLASCDPKQAIHEIHRFTRAIGLGTPLQPRVVELIDRMNATDYEGVSMRLTQFQRTVNPPADVLRRYEPVIRSVARRAAARYSRLLRRMSMDVDDLVTIGTIYFCNHWHQYAEKSADGLNEKFLVHSLQQQFGRWYQVTWRKLANIDGSGSGLEVGDYCGQPVLGGQTEKNRLGEAIYSIPMEDILSGEEVVPASSVDQEESAEQEVRRNVTAALEAQLAAMPHDKWVETLREVSANEFLAYDARKEADRRLKQHRHSCSSCLPT